MPVIGGVYYPYEDEAVQDTIDQASPYNVANSSSSSDKTTDKKWYDYIPGVLGGVADVVRSNSQSSMELPGFDNELTGETTEKINTETEQRLADLRSTLNDILYFAGVSPAESTTEKRKAYPNAFEPMAQRGYNLLFGYEPTKLGTEEAEEKIGTYLQKYGAFNRPQFMAAATGDTVRDVDPSVYEPQIKKYMDTAEMSKMYDYSSPQTQEFISGAGAPGSRYSRERMAGFFGSPDIKKQFMEYSSYA